MGMGDGWRPKKASDGEHARAFITRKKSKRKIAGEYTVDPKVLEEFNEFKEQIKYDPLDGPGLKQDGFNWWLIVVLLGVVILFYFFPEIMGSFVIFSAIFGVFIFALYQPIRFIIRKSRSKNGAV